MRKSQAIPGLCATYGRQQIRTMVQDGDATNPKRLQSTAIKRLLSRALWEQGIRQVLARGIKRHEWKGTHGYRKALPITDRLDFL